MAFTVADVLMAARDMNPAFTPTRHPDAVCRRWITRYVKTLVGKIAEQRPSALSATVTTVTLSTFNFTTGTTVPDAVQVLDAYVHRAGYPADHLVKVDLPPAGDRRARTQRLPYGWLDGAKLFLAGEASDYALFDQLIIRSVAMPTVGGVASDTLPLPDDALNVCSAQLAGFLALRHAQGPDTEKFDARPFVGSGEVAETQFLSRLMNQAGAEVWRIKRVGY